MELTSAPNQLGAHTLTGPVGGTALAGVAVGAFAPAANIAAGTVVLARECGLLALG
jgi:hypothetical protein